MIHPRTLQALEFDKIIAALATRCLSGPGTALAQALKPLADADAAHRALRLYEEAALWSATPEPGTGKPFALTSFPDTSGLLEAAATEAASSPAPAARRAVPDTEAFWALRELLRLAARAHASIVVPEAARQWPLLLETAQETPLPVQLAAALDRCISDDALLRDESSPELYRLRNEVRRLHQGCLRKVKDFARQYNLLPYLQDEFMTLSSDRYVLPLKANFKVGCLAGLLVVAAGYGLSKLNAVLYAQALGGGAMIVAFLFFRLLLVVLCGMAAWIFPVLSRFTFGVGGLLAASAKLALAHPLATAALGVLTGACIWVSYVYWLPALVLPYLWARAAEPLLERVFKPFMEAQGEA